MFSLLARAGILLSHAHVVVHALQIVGKGLKVVVHSNLGLLGLDRLLSHFGV
jgi:hypothetical protein